MSHFSRLQRNLLFIGCTMLALLLAGVVALQGTLNTHAAGGILFVGHSSGLDTGCASPGFTSIQAAVDAAHTGNEVYLCGNVPYAQQVIITKAITLTGDRGATLVAPAAFSAPDLTRWPAQFTRDNLFVPQVLVLVWGAGANARITNLTISGVMPGNGSCAENEFGVLVIAGGTVTLSGDQIKDIRDNNSTLYGCQFGNGVQIGRESWPVTNFSTDTTEKFIGHATIVNTMVSGYQKDGIVVDGPGSTAFISNNTVTGAGRDTSLAPIIAQNGIQISRGASAQIVSNQVKGNSYTGQAYASSSGILVYGGCGDPLVTGALVTNNTLVNNDVGIYLNNYNSACSAPAPTVTNDLASYNTIRNDAVSNVGDGTSSGFDYKGYQAGIDDIGNTDRIIHNTISSVGYTPVQSTPGGPFVKPIDITSFATIKPVVAFNTIR